MLRLHVLASGSAGNASIVENTATGQGVLIDCGITKKALFERAELVGFDLARLCAIVVTHDHSDHVKGLGVGVRGLNKLGIHPVLYADEAVIAGCPAIADAQRTVEVRSFRMGDALSLGGMQVHPFETSHDALSSCGFRFEADGIDGARDALGFLTDSGVLTGAAREALSHVRVLALESNHDLHMLETGPYPYPVKRRIASDSGHLSNEQSAQALRLLLQDGLEHVVAMHVSENNNTYRLAHNSLADVVTQEGHPAVVESAYQSRTVSC